MLLSAGDCWNDADLISVLELGLLILQEADVLLIDVDVNKAAHSATVIEQPLFEARIAGLKLGNRLVDRGGIYFNNLLVIGQLSEWSGDSDFFCHRIKFARRRHF